MNWELDIATAPRFGRCSGRCCRKLGGELVASTSDAPDDWYCIPCVTEIVRDELPSTPGPTERTRP